jgi:hypothetical protein
MENIQKKQAITIVPESDTVRIINEDYATRKVHDWNTRAYQLSSIQAVIDVIKAKGDKSKTIISYNDSKVVAVLDDTIQNRPLDEISYSFEYSLQMKFWLNLFGKPLSQKILIDCLKQVEDGEVSDRDKLMATLKVLNVATSIVGEYTYDDNNNIGFMYKSKDAEGSGKIPQEILVTIPIFNESDLETEIPISLELNKPRSEEEKPTIALTCPKFNLLKKVAVKHETDKLKKALDGYLILAGSL